MILGCQQMWAAGKAGTMDGQLDLEGLQELMWSFAGHRVITVAARTGMLGRLAGTGTSVECLAQDLDLDQLATGKVVRALCALGLVVAEGDQYRVGDQLAPFLRPGTDNITAFLQHLHGMYDSWGANLEPWLRGQEWATRSRTPDSLAAFGAAMQAMGTQVARLLADRLDLDGVRRVLDVGGGFGHYARALCAAKEDLSATVLDIPDVADIGGKAMASTEFADRIEFVGGDYLSGDFGTGYDLVLLANVLHQENEERAAWMIRAGAGALARGGRLVVLDFIIDDEQRSTFLGTLFAINMRSFGDTHPEPRIRTWMEAAGLTSLQRTDLNSQRWLITGTGCAGSH